MDKKYPSVYNLVDEDAEARKYFNKLPTQVKNVLEDHAREVTTFEILKSRAESYMQKP